MQWNEFCEKVKDVQWNELCEKAKDMGAKIYDGCIIFKGLEFIVDGVICLDEDTYDEDGNEFCACVAKDLSYDQMYQIMKILQRKDE